jgi:hypothetical protein
MGVPYMKADDCQGCGSPLLLVSKRRSGDPPHPNYPHRDYYVELWPPLEAKEEE